jgi:hypothetical protein
LGTLRLDVIGVAEPRGRYRDHCQWDF